MMVKAKDVKADIGALLDRLRACWGFSPTVDRNVATVEGFLNGKSFADLAQTNGLSKTRVRQIIEKADRLAGGGILTEPEEAKSPARSDFMVAYPYVWSLADTNGLGSLTPHLFFNELQRMGSLACRAGIPPAGKRRLVTAHVVFYRSYRRQERATSATNSRSLSEVGCPLSPRKGSIDAVGISWLNCDVGVIP